MNVHEYSKKILISLVSTICQQLINFNFCIPGTDVMFASNIEQKNILGGKLTISILVCILCIQESIVNLSKF